jgi:hypothetical protein
MDTVRARVHATTLAAGKVGAITAGTRGPRRAPRREEVAPPAAIMNPPCAAPAAA